MRKPMSEPIDKPGEVEDPVIRAFLDCLAKDMAKHPEQLQLINASLAQRLQSLVDDVAVDLDAPLSPDDGWQPYASSISEHNRKDWKMIWLSYAATDTRIPSARIRRWMVSHLGCT